MSKPPAPTPVDPASIDGAIAAIEAELAPVLRAAQHLDARVESFADEGEYWSVDLAEGVFSIQYDGDIVSAGTCQLVATYLPDDGTLLWGAHNPSVSKGGGADVTALSELGSLTDGPRFTVAEQSGRAIAEWAAWRLGGLPFTRPVGDAIATLSVQLSAHHEQADDANEWCSLCGTHRTFVNTMIQGGPAAAICDECARLMVDVAATSSPQAGSGADDDAYPCLMCGEHKPRAYAPHAAMCYDCIGMLPGILGASNAK